MTDLKQLTVRCYDNGTFIPFCRMLTRHFGCVEYFNPWQDMCPTSSELDIGKGFEGEAFIKIDNFWDDLDSVDVFVFPDIYEGGLQKHLRSLGKLVWGSGDCEKLEIFRADTKELMKSLDMPVNKYETITGIDSLREYLMDDDNCDRYIKVQQARGDCESFHHINYKLSEPRLNEIQHHLGARSKIMEFVVEHPIKSDIEVGYDGYTIDGEFPKTMNIFGYEIKDAGYVAAVMPYAQLPEPVRWVNAKLAPIFRKYQYRGNWSSEIRVDKKDYYLLDPCARAGSPPSEVYSEMISNWGDIIYNGAQGILVEPKFICKYGVQVMIHSSWGDKNDVAVHFPPELAQWIKIRFACQIEGTTYAIPQNMDMGLIGSIVAIDDTLLGAIRKVGEYAKQVEAYGIDIRMDSIPKAINEIRDAEKKYGYKFGVGPVPVPEIVAKVLA